MRVRPHGALSYVSQGAELTLHPGLRCAHEHQAVSRSGSCTGARCVSLGVCCSGGEAVSMWE